MPTGSEILEHEPGDLTCIVEARHPALGAAGRARRARAAAARSTRPATRRSAECLLDDLSGPLRHRFGTMRDLVIGVTVVLPDGMRASSGGKVVKNVAGYDLGEALLRLARPARRGRAARAAAASAAGGGAHGRRRRRTWLRAAPLAARAERGRPRRRDGCTCSSRDRSGRSTRRSSALGGEEADPWDELRALQAALPGPRALGRRAGAARPAGAARRLRRASAREPAWSPLAERVAEAMCSPS